MASTSAQTVVQVLERAQGEWHGYARPTFYEDFASGFTQAERQFVGRFLIEEHFDADRVRLDPTALADLVEQLDVLDESKKSTRLPEIKDSAMQMCLWLIAQAARKLYRTDWLAIPFPRACVGRE